jgi:hypothetical protein
MKLGKLAPKRSLKTLALGNYLTASKLPVPPVFNAWENSVKVPWQMLKNDSLGDCTCAAVGHMIMNWTANTSTVITPTDNEIVQAYSAVSDYIPGNESTDNGAVELDVLNYWKSTGIAGHKILGFATLDVQNIEQVKAAIFLFGGVYTGFEVPQYAMNENNWVVQNTDTQIIGGHAVPYFGYGRGGATCVTWGKTQPASWEFWQKYTDEAYAVVSQDWINTASQKAPSGLDLQTLLTDLQAI